MKVIKYTSSKYTVYTHVKFTALYVANTGHNLHISLFLAEQQSVFNLIHHFHKRFTIQSIIIGLAKVLTQQNYTMLNAQCIFAFHIYWNAIMHITWAQKFFAGIQSVLHDFVHSVLLILKSYSIILWKCDWACENWACGHKVFTFLLNKWFILTKIPFSFCNL